MFNVVIEYTASAGGYEGNRFWTSFKDEDDFKRAKVEADPRHRVIATGVSDEKAIALTAMVPECCRIRAALHEIGPAFAADSDELGEIARFHLQNAVCAIVSDRKIRMEAERRQDSVDEATDED